MRFRPHVVITAPLLALAAAACAPDSRPTTAGVEVGASRPALAVSGRAVTTLLSSVESARIRVLPALGEGEAGTRMARSLWQVETALRDNDGAGLALSLRRAQTTLKAQRATLADSGVAAELDALLVTFTAMEAAVPAPLRQAAAD